MTTYNVIYDRFMSKIEDYGLLDDMLNDTEYYEAELLSYLKGSIPKFTYCVKDLTNRDDISKQFNITLSELEQEILSIQMILEYISPNIIKDDNMKSRLGSKDYNQWSPANQMKEVRTTKESIKKDLDLLMAEYYYGQGFD